MNEPQFQFEWNETKAAANLRKHGISFEHACTVFRDAHLLSIADLEHGENEERWFALGSASNGAVLSITYLWKSSPAVIKIRIISARRATQNEVRQYQENL